MIQSYPWYIADWRDSETRIKLTLAERGLYRELIDYCYLEGSLPADRSQIKLLSASDGHDFARAWIKVQTLFDLVSTPNGKRFVHSKVTEVRERLEAYHEQNKHAGVKSGQARRERLLNARSNGNGTDAGPDAEPSPTPTPTPIPTTATAQPLPVELRPQTEYPETLKVIREHDASADVFIVQQIADSVGRAIVSDSTAGAWSVEKQARAVSDPIISRACRESYATPRKGPHGTGLLKFTVPTIILGGKLNYV
jgi:uncharacterized protein YdaU (DUF1376 family)